ncbi:hypothetical protein FO519_006963 [Halicephalobus sp. NKZ332]|nr:hypothetical protein FO519_006963 [Halicephalobus sp. NKZ332]
MAHYIDPNKRISFVKAKGNLQSTQKSTKSVNKLDGKEIAEFYRSLINEEMKDYIRRGIDINSRDFFGCTALICAVAQKAEDVVEFLMENGADWTIAGQNGLTALGLAKKKKFTEIVNFIESFESPTAVEEVMEECSASQFCDGCKQQFVDISAHHCSIVHIINSSQQPREGYAYGIPMSNIGYQMLKDTGWSESRGLGKEGVGRKYPLKTVLKRDRKGLGSEKQRGKITHFEAGDTTAIKTVKKEKRSYFKALQERKKREKKIERILVGPVLGNTDRLVGLNGDSQNSRYVEIRRSPSRTQKVDDAPSFSNLPKAHGISSDVPESNTATEIRHAPQSPQGAGFSSPFASLIPGMPSVSSLFSPFPMMLPPMLHQPIPQPSQVQHILYQPNVINGLPLVSGLHAQTPAPKHELRTDIQTLSATQAPVITLPTLPTLIPMPTFPPFTLPPSFDKMAAGYTKKKRRRKLRRKAPKMTSESPQKEDSFREVEFHSEE